MDEHEAQVAPAVPPRCSASTRRFSAGTRSGPRRRASHAWPPSGSSPRRTPCRSTGLELRPSAERLIARRPQWASETLTPKKTLRMKVSTGFPIHGAATASPPLDVPRKREPSTRSFPASSSSRTAGRSAKRIRAVGVGHDDELAARLGQARGGTRCRSRGAARGRRGRHAPRRARPNDRSSRCRRRSPRRAARTPRCRPRPRPRPRRRRLLVQAREHDGDGDAAVLVHGEDANRARLKIPLAGVRWRACRSRSSPLPTTPATRSCAASTRSTARRGSSR